MARAIALLPQEIRPYFEKYQAAHRRARDRSRICGGRPAGSRSRRATSSTWTRTGRIRSPECRTRTTRPSSDTASSSCSRTARCRGAREEIYAKLVEAFTQKTPYPRENIQFFSSVLSHYCADAHVPFHAALNYDGQLTGQWGIHSRFESELFERYQSGSRLSPRPAVPVANARELMFDIADREFRARAAGARRRQGRRRRPRQLRRRLLHAVLRQGQDRCSRSGCRTRSPTPRHSSPPRGWPPDARAPAARGPPGRRARYARDPGRCMAPRLHR